MDRITFLIESLKIGGAERVVANLASEFDKHGWDVDVVVIQQGGPIEDELPSSVRVHFLNANRTLASVRSLVSYFRRRQPDAVISNMTHINVIATLSVKLSRIDTTLVVVEHSLLSERVERINSRKEKLTAMLAGRLYPLADTVVAVSDGLADDIAAVTGIDRSLITTIYNPIDVEYIREQSKKQVDHEWINKDEVSVIIGVGRLEVRKDFTTLLNAFAQVAQNRDIRLIICGDGPKKEDLETLAGQLDIQNNVSFVGWVDNPFKYMIESDAFVSTSKVEGFSNVIVESLAVGCPVISSSCGGGPTEILDGGVWGELFPVGDEEQCAAAIDRALEKSSDGATLQKRADSFDTTVAYNRYRDLLRITD